MEIDESGSCGTEFVRKKYQDLTLDLNLDTATAEEAWSDYLYIRQSYTLEVLLFVFQRTFCKHSINSLIYN